MKGQEESPKVGRTCVGGWGVGDPEGGGRGVGGVGGGGERLGENRCTSSKPLTDVIEEDFYFAWWGDGEMSPLIFHREWITLTA